MLDADEREMSYLLAEYHEAANAYFKGVDIGYTGIKGYVTINSLFAALIVGLAEPKGSFAGASDIVRLIPIFALIVFLALVVILPHYFRHLRNCQQRCREIEKQWGGLLFTRLTKIAERKFKIGAGLGSLMIVGSIGIVWIILAIRLSSFQYLGFIR